MIRFLWRISTPRLNFYWRKFNAALAILWREFRGLMRKYADFRGNQEPCLYNILKIIVTRCFFLGCFMCLCNMQSVSQGRICLDHRTCCHTEIDNADQLAVSPCRYTDTGPTSPSTDPVTPGLQQSSLENTGF